MEKMSIHAALSELKLIDAKIEKKIKEQMPVGIKQRNKKVLDIYDETEFIANAKASNDSIQALIERKVQIKCAIITANSNTEITIQGKKMTVAEAITYKDIIDLWKKHIADLQGKYNRTRSEMEKGNTLVNANCQRILEASFGRDTDKVNVADIDAIRKPFIEANEYHLVDPLKIEQEISRRTEEIMDFEAQVDRILSESNAITFIEI